MFEKYRTLEKLVSSGVVAIVRVEQPEVALRIIQACLEADLVTIEVTFSIPRADRVLESVRKEHPQCLLGAGSVLDPETARIAILSGARYIISPSFSKDTAFLCNRYAIPYLPGCYTPAEAVKALEYGVDIVKLFPSAGQSPSIIKAFKGPLPQLNLMPTGGVNVENAGAWIKAGAVALGIGGDLTAGAAKADYAAVTSQAKAYLQAVAQARSTLGG